MANLALVTPNWVRIVESIEQMTLPAAEVITAGQAVRIDTTTGRFTLANGTTTVENRIYGVATQGASAAGIAITAVRRGVLDGWNLTQAYDATIYLSDTDGALGDTAGTVNTVVGRVIPATSTTLGTAYDKLLHVGL